MTTYQKYKNLRNWLNYSYTGVELSHVFATKIWQTASGKRVLKKQHLCRFVMSLDLSKLKLPENNGFMATFMNSYRKDHFDLFNTVTKEMTNRPAITNLYELKQKFSFHPTLMLKITRDVFKQLKGSEFSTIDKLLWASEYVYWCNVIEDLNKIDFSNTRKYLCMCHVISVENLLTQYLRKLGVETFSLQEGMYMVYRKNIVLGSIAYELFATDHLLCWGQYTKDQFIEYGIDSNRIDVAGYPKGQVIKTQKRNNQYRKCLVMLAGPIFGDVNLNLLSMLESLNGEVEVTLKSHPANYKEMEEYANNHKLSIVPRSVTIADCYEKGDYDFCIAVNTTAYFESWIAGIPCIRYFDERFDNFYGFDDLFSTRKEFDTLLNQYRTKSKTQEEVKEMLEYAIGFGFDNYNKIVNG